jgi:hypothetical protein
MIGLCTKGTPKQMADAASRREPASPTMPTLARRIKDWGQELGFASIGIASADVSAARRG